MIRSIQIKTAIFLALAIFTGASRAEEADSSAKPVAEAARLAGDAVRTRFVMDLVEPVDFAISTLADPYRVIIDLPETRFDFGEDAGKDGRGLVSAWRYGRFARGKSRIVLDAVEPVTVDKSFILPPVDDQPARLVLDLVKTTREAFLEGVSRPEASAHTVTKGDKLTAKQASSRPLIVIDPGHGGIDTGATGRGGTLEKQVALDFSSLLKRKLEETGRYDVEMTRDSDVFIPLKNRVEIARSLEADLFISVHADSVRVGKNEVRGASVYTLSEKASDAVAAELAERENRSDIIAGVHLEDEQSEVADILIDLARRETKKFSIFFARTLVDELKSAARVIKNPHRSAGFRVLEAHDMPSALVELGYLSNRLDEKLLTSDEWRERMSTSLVAAVDRFFRPRLVRNGAVSSAETAR
ncbi:N-acetylmuramoyl-L-alanine amidase [Stappia sediminis]|uniref:N-acetylmuramoyl-L-alanine amidase n=1 Tax=Stappia sediminis TaxID=2692190 RepID=UPI0028ACC8AB|nr:N-acetylmuramoyl-L-alanine amidase [Stappia sediminis]